MLAAAANSNPGQPNWKIAGNYANATDCVAAIGQNVAENAITSGIFGWASGELGSASGAAAPAAPSVAPLVCLPSDHPWVASVGGAGPSGQGRGAQPAAQPSP